MQQRAKVRVIGLKDRRAGRKLTSKEKLIPTVRRHEVKNMYVNQIFQENWNNIEAPAKNRPEHVLS